MRIEIRWGSSKLIILAVLSTIIIGWIGAALGHDFMNGFSESGSILAVATMGSFIMIENERRNKE